MASNVFRRYTHGHEDLVLATAYNIYGTRLATASSDHHVRVWDRAETTGEWTVTDTWTAHTAEVTDIKWVGPFLGEHLATISEDGRLRIWAEDSDLPPNSGRRFRQIHEQLSPTGVPYMSLDIRGNDASTHLALATRDGHLTVAEPEHPDSLASWRPLWSDHLCRTPPRTVETAFRLSWHHERGPPAPAVLAGLDRGSLGLAVAVGDVVKVFRTDKERKFYTAAVLEGSKGLVRDVSWASASARGFDTLATACKDGFVRVYDVQPPSAGAGSAMQSPHLNGTASSAVQSPGSSTSRQGRSEIGAGLAGGARGRREDGAGAPGAVKQEARLVAEFEVHDGAPWRVNWSARGDMLVTTGDDGTVGLFKRTPEGKWLAAAEVDGTRQS